VVSTVVKSKAGRPKHDPVIAEREALIRIAVLASNILATLRQPGRGRYDSERHLGRWLTSDGYSWTTADLSPALALLEASLRLIRASTASQRPLHGLDGLPVMLSCEPQRTSPTRHG
jgi:hypothetical protein